MNFQGTGIIGVSLGLGYIRLDEQLVTLVTPSWSLIDYESFDAGAYPEWTVGVYFTPRFSTRLRYGRVKLEDKATGDRFTYENYGLDAQYYFYPEANTRPFVTFGIGEEIFGKDRDQTNFLWTFGLGLHHKINNNWAVYGNWIRHESPSTDVTEQSVSVNLLYRFGRGEDGGL